ncbi:hypothetical protein L7F22_006699 [Adiantum nelumboides]|nr:hypothetical protein [Adiantum nelumboides]
MASGEGQSNPSTFGDAGGDHNEDNGNEYGPPLPTQEELREMEHRRLVGEATNLMLNFAKDPKLTKYMTETVFQDVHAQWKATTTSPPKPDSKKQYLEKELEEQVEARLARILGVQTQGKKHDKKRKKSTDFPGYLGAPVNSFKFIQPLMEGLGYQVPSRQLNVKSAMVFAWIFWGLYGLMYPWLDKAWLPQPPFFPTEIHKVGITHNFSILKARQQLGYLPYIGPKEGLQRTLEFWRVKQAKELRSPELFYWIVFVGGMILTFFCAFLPPPFMGPFEWIRHVALIIFRNQKVVQAVFVLACIAHFGEGLYAWLLARKVDPANSKVLGVGNSHLDIILLGFSSLLGSSILYGLAELWGIESISTSVEYTHMSEVFCYNQAWYPTVSRWKSGMPQKIQHKSPFCLQAACQEYQCFVFLSQLFYFLAFTGHVSLSTVDLLYFLHALTLTGHPISGLQEQHKHIFSNFVNYKSSIYKARFQIFSNRSMLALAAQLFLHVRMALFSKFSASSFKHTLLLHFCAFSLDIPNRVGIGILCIVATCNHLNPPRCFNRETAPRVRSPKWITVVTKTEGES